ncbi:ABC transporter G family member 20-like isoform X2 [Sitophilus oryzae]|uniref:ABC transporter G family member 20-like isoform X2 n=1 Tax=Sitophilus oryzae TaxID=7048 RepID=A0A6J2Y5X7_SITOR|nr:ABC transporter G family member 20-like isoform X2 [Sitophilus oryzae]
MKIDFLGYNQRILVHRYGLLGASGCGKTTLLNCIIGRKQYDSGEIQVFGKNPRDDPDLYHKIGFMPQDISLVSEYTIQESVFYFGRLANMDTISITNRFEELSTLLELPPRNCFTTTCSGGEQRRISFVCAIVHSPPLLILDEPTVGLDSLLRDKIWSYLRELVEMKNASIIITTHYIEECSRVNKVGLVRNGKLLAENSPSALMHKYQTNTLEEAYLMLSREQDERTLHQLTESDSMEKIELSDFPITKVENLESNINQPVQLESSNERTRNRFNIRRLRALMDKNFKQFYRSWLSVLLFMILPSTQTVFFKYGIGGEIRDLKFGIVNDELPGQYCEYSNINSTVISNLDSLDCYVGILSCRFLEYLEIPLINKVYYNSINAAITDVQHGEIIGTMHIRQNFSRYYEKRINAEISDSVINKSTIVVYLDLSNRETGGSVKYKLIDQFLKFQEDLYIECGRDRRLAKLPFREQYLYGKNDEPFFIFMLPGMVVSIAFFFGVTMTSQIILSEKCEGIWERSLIAGAKSTEMIVSHLILQIGLSMFQSLAPLIIVFYIFEYPYAGSMFSMALIVFLEGICGLTLGFCISANSKNHIQAHILSTSFLFPTLITCGFMWPFEALPKLLQTIIQYFPFSTPIATFRSIMKKGSTEENLYEIMASVGLIAFWTLQFILISFLTSRDKQKK